MFKDYFQLELKQLKELGAEFAKAHPALAPMLSGPVTDPDVERLLEGVSFQTAKLREKLDDDFPEIIQDLIRIIWPHYLRPIPAATTVAFTPISVLTNSAIIPAGTSLTSLRVEDIQCIFSTCFDVEIHPVSILDASFEQPSGQSPYVKIVMDSGSIRLSDWNIKSLRFFLSGEYAGASDLYFLLTRHLKSIRIKSIENGEGVTLPGSCLKDAGFADEAALIPYPPHAFPGYRIIQEYFFMPEKFLYVDLCGWEHWRKRGTGSRFELYFEFGSLPLRPPKINKDYFVLNATPAINIFDHNAEPISFDHKKPWYLLKPACSNPDNYHIFSVENVSGRAHGSSIERIYTPFEHFRPDADSSPVYHTIYRQSQTKAQPDVWFSVAYNYTGIPKSETISIDLKCTNGPLPESLRIGDININKGNVPQFVNFRNIKPITPSMPPPMGSNLQWKLISLLSLNYLSLKKIENFRTLLEFYIFPNYRDQLAAAANRKRISGIESLENRPADRLLKGNLIRGREVTMKMRQDNFISTGDLHMFGSVLDSFLGSYATLNSFTQLIVKETLKGEVYEWPARLGRHHLI